MPMPMTVKDVLIEARAKIADPTHWTKGQFARATRGEPVEPTETSATCWCVQGAIRTVDVPLRLWNRTNEALEDNLPEAFAHLTPFEFNDHPMVRHEDVLALLDRAIGAQP